MTLQELYSQIGGDYEQALRVMRVEKLIDKHIRKLVTNGVVDGLVDAAERMEPAELFDAAHAMKGICANLGLTALAEIASEIAEEYRGGNQRKLTDEQAKEKIVQIEALYKKTAESIGKYAQG
ncbi:MAG: Hpt domain-containing protein [Ruminococcus sp.]|nr:Hpt domain-containing protein [Ruminococcus sp.]